MISLSNLTVFAFSYTHGHHRDLQVPEGADIIICAGDAVEDDLPDNIDILVTHYPPYGILDEDMGSPDILNFVLKARPKYSSLRPHPRNGRKRVPAR